MSIEEMLSQIEIIENRLKEINHDKFDTKEQENDHNLVYSHSMACLLYYMLGKLCMQLYFNGFEKLVSENIVEKALRSLESSVVISANCLEIFDRKFFNLIKFPF
jgi:hypothetical protein